MCLCAQTHMHIGVKIITQCGGSMNYLGEFHYREKEKKIYKIHFENHNYAGKLHFNYLNDGTCKNYLKWSTWQETQSMRRLMN